MRKPECEPCPRAVFYGGFCELESVPEPPWLVTEDLVKKPVTKPTQAGSAAE